MPVSSGGHDGDVAIVNGVGGCDDEGEGINVKYVIHRTIHSVAIS